MRDGHGHNRQSTWVGPGAPEASMSTSSTNPFSRFVAKGFAAWLVAGLCLLLPAVVSAADYLVSYNANAATSGMAPASQSKTQGVALTLATNTGNLARTGYAFAGWSTTTNGTGTNYAGGSWYMADASVTLYAKWSQAAASYTNPIITSPWGADPMVVDGRDGLAYMYFTDGADSRRMFSENLVNWSNGAAMTIKAAPHVYYDQPSSTWILMGNMSVRQSTSPTSIGNAVTLLGYDHATLGFDPWQFTDPADSKSYLYNGGWQYRHAINQLSSPAQSVQTVYPHFMDGWWGDIWEGPTVLKHGSTYYWFFSLNGASQKAYRLGYATAPSSKGPWKMATWDNEAAILRRSDLEGIYGPGHPCVIQDGNGTWWLYYQQKISTDDALWDRQIALDPMWFDASGTPHARPTRGSAKPGPNSPVTTIWPTVSAVNTVIEAESYAGSAIGIMADDVGRRVVGNLKGRAYLAYRHLDFGSTGVNGVEFTLRNDLNLTGGTGSIEVRTGGVSGPLVGVLPLTYVSTSYRTVSVDLAQTLTGLHDVVLVIQGARPESSVLRLDSFRFLASAPGTASPVPPAPADDVAYVPMDGVSVFAPLANDAGPDGRTLTISGIRTLGHGGTSTGGTAVLNPDQTIAYTPKIGHWGEDRIT
ncbi:MAG TPA: hypothetical protein DCS97_06210, partial [Planctomycetes bacterium]|nr:hypothetical protein [Planctomycetota bacterium]